MESQKKILNNESVYIQAIIKDEFYSKLVATDAFQRLRHISFLGAIDYTSGIYSDDEGVRAQRSRYSHSLGVAALALYISKERKYSRELEKHLVTAALLHDVGHAPLSHSLESKFSETFSLCHHENGKSLVNGKSKLGKPLNKILKDNVDPSEVNSLIGGASSLDGEDLFSSPINIDTIDGIIRASNYHYSYPQLSTIDIAKASFLSNERGRFSLLDTFWQRKGLIYSAFIQSGAGLAADIISQNYFEDNKELFASNDIESDEEKWAEKHPMLFLQLKNFNPLNYSKHIPHEVDIMERDYFINEQSMDPERFVCDKKLSKYSFEDYRERVVYAS
ncbi:HD domain-containing protein [Oceanicoccus sp. KOV_DT_Chl]|uniref:HD domain-containing protein n=1 Tax=Oceanicoccus sp. KOV_DT_Chl TaxID=1904639 RepID=UPI000C7CE1BE|nr:HD domain-containing protein [Oceanicoccus sp. KOV_DT_Chl]